MKILLRTGEPVETSSKNIRRVPKPDRKAVMTSKHTSSGEISEDDDFLPPPTVGKLKNILLKKLS